MASIPARNEADRSSRILHRKRLGRLLLLISSAINPRFRAVTKYSTDIRDAVMPDWEARKSRLEAALR
jgi:hypothetical protein